MQTFTKISHELNTLLTLQSTHNLDIPTLSHSYKIKRKNHDSHQNRFITGRMCAVHTPVSKLPRADLKVSCPAGVTRCTSGVKSGKSSMQNFTPLMQGCCYKN